MSRNTFNEVDIRVISPNQFRVEYTFDRQILSKLAIRLS